jgi:hypothetical protein
MLCETKKPTVEEWVAHATQPEQLTLDLKPEPKVIWRVQIGRYTKGCYQTKYSMESAAQALFYYHGINIGKGYKKRLLKIEGKDVLVVAKQAS